MRIKSQWFKTDKPKTPQESAGAMAFIVWRVAHNTLAQMRSARFDIDIGPQYFAFMREWLVFLIQVVDRMAHARMPADEREAFTTALTWLEKQRYVDRNRVGIGGVSRVRPFSPASFMALSTSSTAARSPLTEISSRSLIPAICTAVLPNSSPLTVRTSVAWNV